MHAREDKHTYTKQNINKFLYIHIYIYICIYRERDTCILTDLFVYCSISVTMGCYARQIQGQSLAVDWGS